MKRLYEEVIDEHFSDNRQMLFLVGPRQVGKTTTSLDVSEEHRNWFYLNWDVKEDRELIIQGAHAIADFIQLEKLRTNSPIIVFDELHKYGRWKTFLKGFFDLYSSKIQIIATGSARMDVYKAGGDSLMGRYFPYRLHPLSVSEIVHPHIRKTEIASKPKRIKEEDWLSLYQFGGFPEPYLKRNRAFSTRWKNLRMDQLFQEDIRDLTRIQELGQMQLLAEFIRDNVGSLVSYSSLAKKVNVSIDTVRRWISTLKSLYYCYTLQPWTKNVSRSLLKEPKIYLWDWSFVEDEGARYENFIASHLLKAVHYWTDRGLGNWELYFLRDKEKREVDFLVAKDKKPLFLVEAKRAQNSLTPALYHFQKMTDAPHAFQVTFEMEYVNRDCFGFNEPIIVPAKTFLSQLI